jgi:hypothetical protein
MYGKRLLILNVKNYIYTHIYVYVCVYVFREIKLTITALSYEM